MTIDKKNKQVSRRGFLGAGLLLPLLSSAKPLPSPKKEESQEEEFTTMLTAQGKAVKVKKSVLKNANVIERKISNQSLLTWLKLKDK